MLIVTDSIKPHLNYWRGKWGVYFGIKAKPHFITGALNWAAKRNNANEHRQDA